MASNAASRVFGTTELLEEILLLAVCNGKSIRENGHNYSPAYKLFALQRVSPDFQHTIAGSKKLRRLMFYETIEASTFKVRFSHHAPTYWLPANMLQPGIYKFYFIPEYDTHATIELQELPLRNPDAENRRKWRPADPGWARLEASWRNIKICNASEGMIPITVNVEVDFHDYTRSHKLSKLAFEKGIPIYASIRWNFRGDDTLGQVFDRFAEFMRVMEDAWNVNGLTRAPRFANSTSNANADEEDLEQELRVWKELEKLSDPPRPGSNLIAVGKR